MTHPILIILFLLTLTSCGPVAEERTQANRINPSVNYDENLKTTEDDTLRYFWSSRERYPFEGFTSRDGYCKWKNDTLELNLSQGFMTVSSFKLFVHNDSVSTSFWKYDCTTNSKYEPIAYRLMLNKRKYKEGDTVYADIFFKGVLAADNKRYFENDTVTALGKIKLKVRNSRFNYDSLSEIRNLAEFYDLLFLSPDTITKVNLYGSGLTHLPIELSQFANLQELSLEQNKLTNADFSILKEFKKLKVLNLQECALRAVPKEIMQLQNLEVLNLYWNNLKEIPDELYSLTSLRDLNIGYNNLNKLSPKISNLKNLQSLETSYTEIKVYPDEMVKLTNLKEIYPRDTMKYIPPSLKKYVFGCDYY